MRSFCRPFTRALAATALAALSATAASAQMSPGCQGRDMLADMKTADPAGFAEMRRVADATKNAKSLLWMIENPAKPEAQPSFLFGTIHLTDDRLVQLSPKVIAALGNARRAALEIEDTSPKRVAEALSGVSKLAILPAGETLASKLNEAERARTQVVLTKAGFKPEAMDRLRPWVALALSAVSECEKSRKIGGKKTVDGTIADRAERFGIGTLGLETVEDQFKAMASVSDQDQLALLKAHLAAQERVNDVTETLVQLYLNRDLGMMLPFQIALARRAGIEPAAFDSFRTTLIDERNRMMIFRAVPHLKRGGLFIGVSALHLVGDNGLVEILRQEGLTVTAIE